MKSRVERTASDIRDWLEAGIWKRVGQFAPKIAVYALAGMFLLSPFEPSSASGERTADDTTAAVPNEYHLGQGDKVRLKVFAWRAAKDEIFAWTPLNGEFSVGVSGSVSLPLLGEIQAAGLSTSDLSHTVGYKLQDRFGLVERPEISVEISQYRPFYIVGSVERPGEYAFRPGITVLQAMSLAGGEARSLDALRLRREVITSSGDLDVLKSERLALVAHKTRLNAELAFSDNLEFPSSLAADGGPGARAIIEQERLVFRARRSSFNAQITTLNELNDYLQKESDSAKSQLTTHEHEVALVREQLDAIRSLVEKKLAIDSRRVDLERNLMQVEGEKLRLQSGVMRVNQDISKTQLSIIELRNTRSQEITADLAATEAKLDQVNRRIATTSQLLADSVAVTPSLTALDDNQKLGLQYQIIRISNGGTVSQFAATELTPIQPGDTIKIDHNSEKGVMATSSLDRSLALYAPPSSARSAAPAASDIAPDSAKAAATAAEAELNGDR
ncbi:MAG: polysaccharide biosynthesis/export family protein [Proteobacteria bacterium]|nr:polysaccharide biosynthesis/export family protein [Pseudomonadota bacterium]